MTNPTAPPPDSEVATNPTTVRNASVLQAALDVPEDSELYSLLETYAEMNPRLQELAEQVDTLKTAIKTKMYDQAEAITPGARQIFAASRRIAVKLIHSQVRGFDSKRLKAENPTLYEHYRKPPKSVWTLKAQ